MIILVLTVFGLSLGSFTNALVWRLHKQTSAKTKQANTKYSISKGRSMCVNCGHQLAPQDLIPVISWLSLGGKCRYCHKPISWQYPLVELLTCLLFIFSYAFWPESIHGYQLIVFIAWLLVLVGFMAAAVYDLRWMILPDRISGVLGAILGTELLSGVLFFNQPLVSLRGPLLGALVCFGFFWILFQVSGGKWIGGGDVKLAPILGLLGGGPVNSFLIIFLASVLGCLFSLASLPVKKINLHSKIPFGPLLMLATVIVYFFGAGFVAWYKQQIGI